jgi:hypothetical protein
MVVVPQPKDKQETSPKLSVKDYASQRTPTTSFFFDTSHNATNHGPRAPIFEGKVPFSRRPSVRLDRQLEPLDGGFHCASDDTLLGGVSRAAVSIYLFYHARGEWGLTGRNRRKCLNTSTTARWTPSPGAPFDGGLYCAFADTLFDGISCSVLSIYSFSHPNGRADSRRRDNLVDIMPSTPPQKERHHATSWANVNSDIALLLFLLPTPPPLPHYFFFFVNVSIGVWGCYFLREERGGRRRGRERR